MSDDAGLNDAPPPSRRVSSDEERERAIREVLRERRQKEVAAEFQRLRIDEEQQRRRGLGLRHGVLLVAFVVALAVWSTGTLWLQEPPPPSQSLAHEEASLRFALYLQAQQIEGYQQDRGRLPEDLTDVGRIYSGIRYFRTERGTYHLEGLTDHFALFYSSSLAMTPGEFLAGAEGRLIPAYFWEEGT